MSRNSYEWAEVSWLLCRDSTICYRETGPNRTMDGPHSRTSCASALLSLLRRSESRGPFRRTRRRPYQPKKQRKLLEAELGGPIEVEETAREKLEEVGFDPPDDD